MNQKRVRPVVLVTGGYSGIGLAIAKQFARSGYRLVICGRDRRKGGHFVKELSKFGYHTVFIRADVAKEEDVKTLISQALQRFGRLDVLCNNAGIQKICPIEVLSGEIWDQVIAINARGPFLCAKYALPHLRKTKGCIVNIGSTGGLVGYAEGAAYCASKAALVMLTKVLALELAQYRVRVNCVCPGATKTPMISRKALKSLAEKVPLGRVGRSKEVADLVLFLVSSSAKQITGGVFVVDGGVTAGRPRLI